LGKLDQYASQEKPHFSSGWLTVPKARHHIVEKVRHVEAGRVDQMQLGLDLHDLRNLLELSPLDDVYNVDKTGLFWKALPDRTLASERLSGGKVAKEWLSAVFGCIVSGTHKLLGPRCFKSVNVHNLTMEWRANKKA